jgi:hypothetical protein
MDRFQKYLYRPLLPDRLSDSDAVAAAGFRGRWVPEELQPFDEVELARSLDDATDLLVTLAVEEGKIARMMLGKAPAGDDDADATGLTEDELAAAVAAHGDAVERLMDHLTGGAA